MIVPSIPNRGVALSCVPFTSGIVIQENGDKIEAVLNDGTPYSPWALEKDIPVDIVRMPRTFTPGTNSTIILPFDFDTAWYPNVDFYKPMKVYRNGSTTSVDMEIVRGFVPAHTPLCCIPHETTLPVLERPVVLKLGTPLSYDVESSLPRASVLKMMGCYRHLTFSGQSLYTSYGFAGSVSGTGAYEVGSLVIAGVGAWTRPGRCFMRGDLNSV